MIWLVTISKILALAFALHGCFQMDDTAIVAGASIMLILNMIDCDRSPLPSANTDLRLVYRDRPAESEYLARIRSRSWR